MFHPAVWQAELRPPALEGVPVQRLSAELQLLYTASHWASDFKTLGGASALFDATMLWADAETLDWDKMARWLATPAVATHLAVLRACLASVAVPLPAALAVWCRRRRVSCRAADRLGACLAERYVVRGAAYSRIDSGGNVTTVWDSLTTAGLGWLRAMRVPWRLAYPPARADRHSLGLLAERLGSLLGRRRAP